jgi:hypothetical protein
MYFRDFGPWYYHVDELWDVVELVCGLQLLTLLGL